MPSNSPCDYLQHPSHTNPIPHGSRKPRARLLRPSCPRSTAGLRFAPPPQPNAPPRHRNTEIRKPDAFDGQPLSAHPPRMCVCAGNVRTDDDARHLDQHRDGISARSAATSVRQTVARKAVNAAFVQVMARGVHVRLALGSAWEARHGNRSPHVVSKPRNIDHRTPMPPP